MKRINVMIIDDSKFIRVLFTGLLSNRDDIEVVGASGSQDDASEKIASLQPDVIVLDVNMRNMDSINFLDHIMAENKLPVIMASSTELEDVDIALRGLEAGAVEYIIKPSSIENYKHISEFAQQLEEKIKIAASCNIKATIKYSTKNLKSISRPPEIKYKFTKNSIIALGSTTGGVEAIRQILTRMPENSPPIVIAQHLPLSFSEKFASRLSKIAMIDVKVAKHGEKLKNGFAYVIPGDQHIQVEQNSKNDYKLIVVKQRKRSLDEFFNSVSDAAGENAVGVILSGVNDEGVLGLMKMKKGGAITLSQSIDSCIASQMPKAAQNHGAVTEELPIDKMADKICALCILS